MDEEGDDGGFLFRIDGSPFAADCGQEDEEPSVSLAYVFGGDNK